MAISLLQTLGRVSWSALLSGLATLVFGVLLPAITAIALPMLIATAIRLRKEIADEWLLILSGAPSVVFGPCA